MSKDTLYATFAIFLAALIVFVVVGALWETWRPRKRHVVSGFDKFRADIEAACLNSPSNRGLSGWVNAAPIKPGDSFQFREDNWPEGVPVESLGREHGA